MDEIKEYKYKNCYLVYARKSTDDKDNQKNSISYQRTEGLRLAKQDHLVLAPVDVEGLCKDGIISERHTAFKENDYFSIKKDGTFEYRIERPKFALLSHYLHLGYFKGAIFLCWDRATRNDNDDNILKKLIKQGVDIRFVQANYENTSYGTMHMEMDGMVAKSHSRITSEKVRNTTKKLRGEGVCTYRAPVGYLNTGDPRKKPFDPGRAPIVKQLFEKYASGMWSLIDLAQWANEQGLTMPAVRRKRTHEEMMGEEEITIEPVARPITFKHVHYILRNPFYIGLIIGPHKSYIQSISHEPLIDKALFADVQKVLKSKRISVRYETKLDYAYRSTVHCGYCHRVYTPYVRKGIEYYGARCAEGCQNPMHNTNKAFIEHGIDEILSQLTRTVKHASVIDDTLDTSLKILESERQKLKDEHERKYNNLLENMSYLQDNKLTLLKTGVYTPEAFIEAEAKLSAEIESLLAKQVSEASALEVLQDTKKLSELLNEVAIYYPFANNEEKQQILSKVFSELFISENRLQYKARKGLVPFELPYILTCAPSTRISELLQIHDQIKLSIRDLEHLVNLFPQ